MNQYVRFDSVGGASGDMILSALAALGADLVDVERNLNEFFPEKLHLHIGEARASGLNGVRVSVHCEQHAGPDEGEWPDAHSSGHADHGHGHHGDPASADAGHHGHAHAHSHRGLTEIASLLERSGLSPFAKDLSLNVFRALAEAEAAIHGKTPETVHFHEVGAWDSVADIVGACLALEQLGIRGVACGPLPAGTGTIHCAHGEMPNPAPATLKLLEGMAVTQTGEPFELVTPTGAALLRVWTRALEPVPREATVLRSAFGFGSRALQGRPNVLRATLLEAVAAPAPEPEERLVLETNLDDCNPEWLGALTAELLACGALDVWQIPVTMKKGRPGVILGVLAQPADADALRERIFRGTTTFGIRSHAVRRETLARRFVPARTPWGEVPVKLGALRGETITAAPEHDACERLARAHGVTPRQVCEAARRSVDAQGGA
ncbi:MAG: nickel pincer cofactor biosynthesis protein LarC [Kiritimatiellia bacterium]|jgi:uncharacterized protein (TIGR00299 family) protein|nr:nickel pincer cofactor biosynthesis protein LarC [Kiritimatiellia bacterium]